jgi:tRNA U55 pseudouridine synthase TruB
MAIERVDLVNRRNVFKQDEIIEEWRELRNLRGREEKLLEVAIEIEVSAGFYIRKLVEDIGTKLGILATTAEIRRMYYGELKVPH